MNKRKYETIVEQKQHKKLKNKNGITLIALVITIIVMLILAGVSLNATIGENGIIAKAKNTTYAQSSAVLEEYLQQKFFEFFEEEDDYLSKPELLNSKIPNLLLKEGNRNYVINDGKIYYLINKESLPDSIKQSIAGGDSREYVKYSRLIDVYGVTKDLKVYYYDLNGNNMNKNLLADAVNPNEPVKIINDNIDIKNTVTKKLKDIGINVDEELGVTLGNALAIKDLILDGTEINITSIQPLRELKNLETLTIKNVNLENLNGLEGMTNLYYLRLDNCDISNYKNLENVIGLKYLYIYLPETMNEEIANKQVTNLGKGLSEATYLSKLEYLGISGDSIIYDKSHTINYAGDDSKTVLATYSSTHRSKVSDISGLELFNDVIKSNLKYLYLNNNNIKSVEYLGNNNGKEGFSAIKELALLCNSNLKNLDGANNIKSLKYIMAQNCNLENISGLDGCTELDTVSVSYNSSLTSLNGIENNKKISWLYADNCNLNNIDALVEHTSLYYLRLSYNLNLINVERIGDCINLKRLYLTANENMDPTQLVNALDNKDTHILLNCGTDISFPSRYQIYFSSISSYDYSYSTLGKYLTDTSDEIVALCTGDRTKVTRLNLKGQNKISNKKLQEVISNLPNMIALNLNGCSLLSSVEFVNIAKNIRELDIRETSLLIDLTPLNEYGTSLRSLFVNNSKIGGEQGLKSIETCIRNIESKAGEGVKESWYSVNGYSYCGFMASCSFDYSVLTALTAWYRGSSGGNSGIIDLSNCKNLTYIWDNTGYASIKVPSSCTGISTEVGENFGYYDLSEAISLQSIYVNGGYGVINSLKTLPKENNLSSLWFNRTHMEDMSGLEECNLNNLKVIAYTSYSHQRGWINSLKGISSVPNLEKLTIGDCNIGSLKELGTCSNLKYLSLYRLNLTSLEGIELCNNLETLMVNGNTVEISNISSISNLTNLKSLYLNKCGIGNITALAELKQIETSYNEDGALVSLILSNNPITDITPLENMIDSATNKINFTELNLNNCLLEGSIVANNLQTLQKLKSAGLQKIYISGNRFSENDINKIINIFGKNNVVR